MSNEQELDINECVQQYLTSLKNFKPLKKEEERQLLLAYKLRNDLNARNKLIESNLKYACKLANGFRNKGLSFGELISEANSGLLDAIEKYDIQQDVKLISYSKWWIIQRMQSALEKQNRIIREDLPLEYNDDVDFCDESIDNDNFHINLFITENEQNVKDKNDRYLVDRITSQISEREKDMIYRYYGINQKEKSTLEDIGKKYGLTRERVRQIIDKAMTKMRSEAMLIESSYL
jgi:RNA polymerase primary sigma factor